MRRLFVISDLHMGGRPDEYDQSGRIVRPGYQICNAYEELIGFVDWVAARGRQPRDGGEAEEVELVINGDIVDYLADDDFSQPGLGAQVWTVDEADAVTKLERIAERTRCRHGRGVFEALRDFLGAGHRLTLLLGNHDVELSLPAVRARLVQLLGGDGSRLNFIYDGEAYTVGRALIEHGNRYDRWNMIDYSALRQERSVRSRRLPVAEDERAQKYFLPPAGTHLVIRFMNRIKSRYRFVDLLKPETETILPLLLALEPERRPTVEEILEAVGVARKYLEQGLEDATTPKESGYLRMVELRERPTLEEVLRGTLGEEDLRLFVERPEAITPEDAFADPRAGQGARGQLGLRSMARAAVAWLAERYGQFEETRRSASKLAGDLARGLTRLAAIRRAPDAEERFRQLHAALRVLEGRDRSFDEGHEAACYLDAARKTALGGGFEAVVYGHTHLPKRIHLHASGGPSGAERPAAVYLNTGTWCDVIRLPKGIAADFEQAEEELLRFFDAVDRNDFSRYVKRYLSYAELAVDTRDDGRVREARLYSYCGPGREQCEPLTDARER
jgi:UDP-2,3-diacylglucosamine pyrophosphatase LpxH